jgi:DNA-binding winged helix-turn-helix (wHTH) protein
MNIQTVAQNLRNTIAGKEELLAFLKGRRIPPEVSIHYLEININELRRILEDVEQCIKEEV